MDLKSSAMVHCSTLANMFSMGRCAVILVKLSSTISSARLNNLRTTIKCFYLHALKTEEGNEHILEVPLY